MKRGKGGRWRETKKKEVGEGEGWGRDDVCAGESEKGGANAGVECGGE